MVQRVFWIAVLLTFAAGAASAGVISVHELKVHWRDYDGKTVTLRGQIDSCTGWDCMLCPEDMAPPDTDVNRCVAIAFGRQNDPDYWGTARPAWMLQRDLYRFATVTLTADFSVLCMFDERGEPVGPAVCTDGPAQLDDARDLIVHSRKTADDGLSLDDSARPLRPAPPPDAAAMQAEFDLVLADWKDGPHVVLLAELSDLDISNKRAGDIHVIDGVGCVCTADSCDGRWPRRVIRGMNSLADPYRCWAMRRTSAGWRLLPDF